MTLVSHVSHGIECPDRGLPTTRGSLGPCTPCSRGLCYTICIRGQPVGTCRKCYLEVVYFPAFLGGLSSRGQFLLLKRDMVRMQE
jgi:hypothetical protein